LFEFLVPDISSIYMRAMSFVADRNRAFLPNRWLPRWTGYGAHPGRRPLQIPSSLGSTATSLGSYEHHGWINWTSQGVSSLLCFPLACYAIDYLHFLNRSLFKKKSL